MIPIGTRVRVALLVDEGPIAHLRMTMQEMADLLGSEGIVVPLDPADLSNRDVEAADPPVNVALDGGAEWLFDEAELEVVK